MYRVHIIANGHPRNRTGIYSLESFKTVKETEEFITLMLLKAPNPNYLKFLVVANPYPKPESVYILSESRWLL